MSGKPTVVTDDLSLFAWAIQTHSRSISDIREAYSSDLSSIRREVIYRSAYNSIEIQENLFPQASECTQEIRLNGCRVDGIRTPERLAALFMAAGISPN